MGLDDHLQPLDDQIESGSHSEDEPIVLIRTPLCRRKVFKNELAADLWASARSFLRNKDFSAYFIDFWAVQIVKQFETDEVFEDLRNTASTYSGSFVNDISDNTQRFIRNQLENHLNEVVAQYQRYLEIISKYKEDFSLHSAVSLTRNMRAHMEDHCVVLENVVHPRCGKVFSLFTLFDGHNGSETACFAAKHLPYFILNHENPFNPFAIREAFLHIQALLTRRCAHGEELAGGTTVVFVLIVDGTAHIAWLGDSTAYAVKDNRILFRSVPHRPNRRDELERILKGGGCVTRGISTFRVNGISAVSRSLGDFTLKPLISHEPEQQVLDLGKVDAFVLASDGLSDYCSDTELLDVIYNNVDSQSRESVCQNLIQIAKDHNSSDNISIILVCTSDRWPLQAAELNSRLTESIDCSTTDYRTNSNEHNCRVDSEAEGFLPLSRKRDFITDISRPLSAVLTCTTANSFWNGYRGNWAKSEATLSNSNNPSFAREPVRPFSDLV